MDEQDREQDILQHVRERLESFDLIHNRQINTDHATERLNDAFTGLTRRDKGAVRQHLDRGSLSRRDFLKLLGVSVGTAATIGVLSALKQDIGIRTDPTAYQAAGSYETIELSEGEHERYSLEAGEVFENVLIDQSADDAAFTIEASVIDDWTIRNIGFLGEGWRPHENAPNTFQITVGAPSGGNGLIENIYINEIIDGPTDSVIGGIFSRRKHAGHIDVRHTYVQGCGNNAAYCSGPGKTGWADGGQGTLTFENCYHRDNTVSQYRIGTTGSVVRNSVGLVEDTENDRGGYPTNGSRNTRCVWGRHFPGLTAENSSFYVHPDEPSFHAAFMATHMNRSMGPQCELSVNNCSINEDNPQTTNCSDTNTDGHVPCDQAPDANVQVENLGNDPTLEVIGGGGVPTSPEEAAQGVRSAPPAPGDLSGSPREGPGLGGERSQDGGSPC